jgi:hypothetical protein
MSATPEALIERLDRLEYQMRWWRRLGVLGISLGLALGLMGAAATKIPDEIRAKRFAVVDKTGRRLAEFYAEDSLSKSSPYPVLAFYQSKGRAVIELGVFLGETPRLAFWDRRGTPRGSFFVSGNDGGVIVRDEKGTDRAILKSTGLELRDAHGNETKSP